MTWIVELDLDCVTMNQAVKYLGRRSFMLGIHYPRSRPLTRPVNTGVIFGHPWTRQY